MEDMTEKELITVLIDKYTDLQRIKRANNGVENQELEYQIKVTIAKLASLGGYYVMTEKEWRMFNDILLEIYYAGSLETFGERCLKLIRILIPYTQGYFLVIDEDGRLDVAHSVFENVDPVMKRKYLDTYFAKDYLMQMCNFTKSMAYRDTDLLTDEKRRASVIYREYFKPQKLDMGCGLIIMKEGKTRVFLNLLRKCGEPDVTGHEMEILQTFLPHFEKNVFAYANHYVSGAENTIKNREADLLSGREQEIVRLVRKGYSNQEIARQLLISEATVKKHLSNIFEKLGISRRTQLF